MRLRRVLLAMVVLLGTSVAAPAATGEEEATQQILANLFDACKAGRPEDFATQFNEVMSDESKRRGGEINLATLDGQQKAASMCQDLNQRYGEGYAFGKVQKSHDGIIHWEVVPKGHTKGQLWVFQQTNGKWTLLGRLSVPAAPAPTVEQEAAKQILANLFDACKAGRAEDFATQFNEVMPDEIKRRGGEINLATLDGQQKAAILCQDLNQKYGEGYEFGTMQTQDDVIGWEVFPKGRTEGEIWAFQQTHDKWTLVDVDPAER